MSQVELVEESVKVPKELNEVRLAVRSLVTSIKSAKADGLDLAVDIPAVVMASYKDVVKAIEDVDKVPAEVREALSESVVCAGMLGADVLAALK